VRCGLTTSLRAQRSNPSFRVRGDNGLLRCAHNDVDMTSPSRGVHRPRFASSLSLRKSRAQGMPGAGWHPRSRVQDALKNAHTSIQVQPEQPGTPCAREIMDTKRFNKSTRCGCRVPVCVPIRCGPSPELFIRPSRACAGAGRLDLDLHRFQGPHRSRSARTSLGRRSPRSKPPLRTESRHAARPVAGGRGVLVTTATRQAHSAQLKLQ
jgi:hypothetical protein